MATDPEQRPATPITEVLEHLERLVLDELDPQASLPSEGELALRFGVSRPTVREAVKILIGRGLIEVTQGRRPRVVEPTGEVIGAYFSATLRRDPSTMLDLLEVRQALEVHTAALAARRASPAAVGALNAAIEDMRAAQTPEGFHDADVRFHELLALAGGNRMLTFLLEGLQAPLRDSFIASYEGLRRRGRHVDEVLDSHSDIVEHVRHRDAQAAADAMRAHLKQAELDLKASLRGPAERRTGDLGHAPTAQDDR